MTVVDIIMPALCVVRTPDVLSIIFFRLFLSNPGFCSEIAVVVWKLVDNLKVC
mgnify:CR=1 FL=1